MSKAGGGTASHREVRAEDLPRSAKGVSSCSQGVALKRQFGQKGVGSCQWMEVHEFLLEVLQLNEALEMGLKRGRTKGQRAAPGWNEK